MKMVYYIVLLLLEVTNISGLTVFNIASMVEVKSSSVLTYRGFNYGATNVVDGNPSTLPDSCNCCWSSGDEQNPWLELTLPQFDFVENIVVQGRTDRVDKSSNLSGLKLLIDGIMVHERSLDYHSASNKVTIDLQNRHVKVFKFSRPGSGGEWFMIICEIFVNMQVSNLFEPLREVAITKQTGLYLNNSDYNSSKAIDGVPNYTLGKCKCCSVTYGSQTSWWQIDLRKKYISYELEIFGRKSISEWNNQQLQHAKVFASNESLEQTANNGTLLYQIPKITETTHFVHGLKHPVTAQFVNVQLNYNIISLCEIIAYGKGNCDSGSFGLSCNFKCNCNDKIVCHPWTGHCQTPGCLPGWQGQACNKECQMGTFGQNCSGRCHCKDTTDCRKHDGYCINGCAFGWKGFSCSEECAIGKFGNGCMRNCHCSDNKTCNQITGKCGTPDCLPGWEGESCETVCQHRNFGDGCNNTCHCKNGTNCNHISGRCDTGLCEPGWLFPTCSKGCGHRTFGDNCSSICHCFNDSSCDAVSGECNLGRCDPGWRTSSCDKESRVRADKFSGSAAAIGGGVGATAALVILGSVLGIFLFRRMRSSRNNAKKETQFSHLDKALKDRKSPQSTIQNANVNRSYEVEQETIMNSANGDDYYCFGEEYMGIRIHELWDYIHSKLENNSEQLISEFKTLPQGLVYSYKSADHISNRGKNRYKEMYAYDHTRVILEDDGNPVEESKTDYINACYIDGYEKVKKFVASQGPTKNMVEDFWRMIWQLKSDKIVMLTNLFEMGKTKCLLYWPKDDEETECSFGNYVIHLLETKTYLDFNIRVLEVKQKGETSRRIHQYHFKSWPDKDVPDSTWCLVNFWRAVDTTAVTTAGPIVVHCSAGVGRTGTFIALDNIVNQAHKEGCVRPLQVVKYLRTQRVNMVQTKEQYVYLHEAVADALYFGTHIIWTRQFGDVLAFMLQKDKDVNQIRLQIQFRLIEKSAEGSASDVAENPEYSNVEMIMSECDAYKPKMKDRGSKYVQQLSAMYIPNYKGKSTFLVSKSPDKDTMEEFWSLVDEQNIKTAIMLTEQSSTYYQKPSCELESSSNGRSRFCVNKIEEKKRKGYTQRTFTFKESNREEEEYLTTVKHFEYTAWKDGYPVPRDTDSLLDMIDTVLKWQSNLSESQPVLVYCSDGFSRSGVVCVLMNELQRMKYEGHVNIVESVKMMKKRQRGLIGNYEQYKFCFDLINDHIKQTDVYQNL